MMVNCPKCGFSQDQDQYCAKCGVDMTTFRRAEEPLVRRLLANTSFQISGLVIVAMIGGLFVRQMNEQERERIISETPVVREIETQETELATLQAQEPVKKQIAPETSEAASQTVVIKDVTPGEAVAAFIQPPAPAPSQNSAAAATPLPSSSPPSTAAPSAAGLRAALAPAMQVRVYFIEIQRTFLSALMAEAQQVSSDSGVSFGVIANLDSRLRATRSWQSLDTSGDLPIRMNQPNVIFKGTRDQASGQNVGFTVQVVPLTRDEAGTHVQIDTNRSLISTSTGFESTNFQLPESFTIPKGGSFIMSGVLPHRTLTEPEERLYRGVSVLKSMATEPFKNSTTDVAIIVETR